MMSVSQMRPSPALAPFIDHFGLREARLGDTAVYTPLPARSDCFLEIYLADRYRIVSVGTGATHLAPRLVLVGPHTRRREDLLLSGTLRVFHIHFTPIGFRALFGVPAHLLADLAECAEAVLGPGVAELADRLSSASDAEQLVALTEGFLLRHLPTAGPPAAPVAAMARALQRSHGGVEIGRLAAAHGITMRQMERTFREHVGVSPKMFGRLARLSHALRLKRGSEADRWADIALEAGFFDQSHMVRDFRALTGETPERFVALAERAKTIAGVDSAKDVAFVLSGEQAGSLVSGA